MGLGEKGVVSEDELTRKINKWYEKKHFRRDCTVRLHKFFDAAWNKFFWFLK